MQRMHHDGSFRPREACGLLGVYGVAEPAKAIYTGLFALQHRGQEGAGIVTSDGALMHSAKGVGLLTEVFSRTQVADMGGHLGIGHVRYSTTGISKLQNVQPLVVECLDGMWAIAHNGNLTNAGNLRRLYQEAGAIFQTSTDSEILVHLIADPNYRARPRRVERALSQLQGAYSFLLMTEQVVMAVRDPYGFRPLSIGRLGNGYIFASETCAIDAVGGTYERDVLPGELVVADERGIRSSSFCEPVAGSLGHCIFEHVYFARPDSYLFGQSVHETRIRFGRRLAEEQPVDADIVIPVPDSGTAAALGYAQVSELPLNYGFIRNHYVGRTFIMPETNLRAESVDQKLAVVPEAIRNQRLCVVDDSIVRGTTSQRRIQVLRNAGAKEVHLRVACPPTRHPCYFGVDFPSRQELAAAGRDVEELRAYIGADSLGYLSLEGMLTCVDAPTDYCTGCYTGRYPVPVQEGHRKEAHERPHAITV